MPHAGSLLRGNSLHEAHLGKDISQFLLTGCTSTHSWCCQRAPCTASPPLLTATIIPAARSYARCLCAASCVPRTPNPQASVTPASPASHPSPRHSLALATRRRGTLPTLLRPRLLRLSPSVPLRPPRCFWIRPGRMEPVLSVRYAAVVLSRAR